MDYCPEKRGAGTKKGEGRAAFTARPSPQSRLRRAILLSCRYLAVTLATEVHAPQY